MALYGINTVACLTAKSCAGGKSKILRLAAKSSLRCVALK